MLLHNHLRKYILCCIGCFCLLVTHAQNWEVNLLKNINNPQPAPVWKHVSGSAYPISVGVPVGIWLLGVIRHDSTVKQTSSMVRSVFVAALVTQGIKVVVNRPRPYQKYAGIYPNKTKDGRSFPSAHTSLAFATAFSLSKQYKKWYVTMPAFMWAGSVGYSRMKLGEHYPTDVLAGAAVGVGSVWLASWLNKQFNHMLTKPSAKQ
jgi:undecaprenyl-diphosphatase